MTSGELEYWNYNGSAATVLLTCACNQKSHWKKVELEKEEEKKTEIFRYTKCKNFIQGLQSTKRKQTIRTQWESKQVNYLKFDKKKRWCIMYMFIPCNWQKWLNFQNSIYVKDQHPSVS